MRLVRPQTDGVALVGWRDADIRICKSWGLGIGVQGFGFGVVC